MSTTKQYTVFMGAPSVADLLSDTSRNLYSWRQMAYNTYETSADSQTQPSQHFSYPAATLEEASRRISLLYENIIFQDTSDADDCGNEEVDFSPVRHATQDQTTMITWAPTPSRYETQNDPSMYFRAEPSRVQSTTFLETQETQSYAYSDASSVARFPDFTFNLHTITPLSDFSSQKQRGKGSRKICTLIAILEVEGPDIIKVKKGVDAGKEIYVLKMVMGNEDGVVCKLTAWREVAESWGGVGQEVGIKRGDIVYVENVLVAWDGDAPLVLTASPNLKSRAEICYRTMPRASFPEDVKLRPDLRLGYSDATVRRVTTVVQWFELLVGLSTP